MGTMLQNVDLSVEDDFQGLEGCNEILNDTRPDVLEGIHRAYFAAGADAVETNTFGCNLSNLGDYDIADRIRELSEKGVAIARKVADEFAADGTPRFVLGSIGPGTKLPTLGHTSFAVIRDAYAEAARGMLEGLVHEAMFAGFRDGGEDCERFRRAAYDGKVKSRPSLLLRSALRERDAGSVLDLSLSERGGVRASGAGVATVGAVAYAIRLAIV